MTEAAFVYLSVVAVVSGLAVVLLRSPIHCALALVLTVFHVTGMLVIMGSGFLAVLNVLVYAGAIIVLFLFTMMLLNLHQHEETRYLHRYQTWLGIPLGALLLIEAVWVAAAQPNPSGEQLGRYSPEAIDAAGGSAIAAADVIFSQYALPFEVAGVLLMAASIAGLVLARRASDEEEIEDDVDPVTDAAGTEYVAALEGDSPGGAH
ncbi:MAG: hypothetical protein F4Y67_10165 [Chloroflexi bacterium]|nr:hypothetical protein [Chloroflexota bacterium]